MNKCHFFKEISSYLDNQLSEGKKIKLEEHLGKCQVCAKELNQIKTLSEKLRQWHLPSLDPSFDSSVKNKIVAWELQGGRVKMKKKTLAILVPSGALAGILVIAFLGTTYFRQGIQGKMEIAQVNPRELAAMMKYKSVNKVPQAQISGFLPEAASYSQALEVGQAAAISGGMDRGDEVVMEGLGPMAFSSGYVARLPKYSKKYIAARSVVQPASPLHVTYSGSAFVDLLPPQTAGQDSVIVIQPLLPATGVGEMIIRTAGLRLEVENGKETYKKISEICQELGGYLAESNFFRDEQGRESGSITLRIPKDKFLTALEKLDTLGNVKDSNTASQDVSQDYANLKSQLDAAKIVYDKMLEALKKRQNTIPEAIKLESELTPVLRRIEVLKNQIERLNNLTSFTTINVNFYESEVSDKVLEDTRQLIKKEMLAAKIRATRWFAQNLLFVGSGVALFVVVVAAIAMLTVWIKQLIKRN